MSRLRLERGAIQRSAARIMVGTAAVAVWSSALQAEKQRALEKEGGKTAIKNLRTFPFISQFEDKGRLALHGAYFDIADVKGNRRHQQ